MAKNKKHIIQKPEDQYPKPDIPADDAWKDMFELLETELPLETSAGQSVDKLLKSNLVKVFAGLVLMGSALLWIYHSSDNGLNIKSDQPKPTAANHIGADTFAETTTRNGNPAELRRQHHTTIDSERVETGPTVASRSAAEPENAEKKVSEETASETASATSTKKATPTGGRTSTGLETNTKKARRQRVDSNRDFKADTRATGNLSGGNSHLRQQPSAYGATNEKPENSLERWRYQADYLKNKDLKSADSRNFKARTIALTPPLILHDSTPVPNKKAFWKTLQAGLFWDQEFAFQSGTSMFLTVKGTTQVWPVVIPGLWLSAKAGGKNVFTIWAKLDDHQRSNQLLQSKMSAFSDSSALITKKYLLLSQGLETGLVYNRTLLRNFHLGVGVAYHHTRKALLRQTTSLSTNNMPLSDSTFSINRQSTDWPWIRPSYISGRVEASYTFGKIQAGVAITMPLSSITDSLTTRPLNGQLFLRWRLR